MFYHPVKRTAGRPQDEEKLVSWYFEPSQSQRVTSGLKETSICLLFTLHASHQATDFQKITKSVPTRIYIKQNTRKHQTQHFRRNSPFGIAPVKKHIRLGHAGIVDHSVDLSMPDFQQQQT